MPYTNYTERTIMEDFRKSYAQEYVIRLFEEAGFHGAIEDHECLIIGDQEDVYVNFCWHRNDGSFDRAFFVSAGEPRHSVEATWKDGGMMNSERDFLDWIYEYEEKLDDKVERSFKSQMPMSQRGLSKGLSESKKPRKMKESAMYASGKRNKIDESKMLEMLNAGLSDKEIVAELRKNW